MLFQYGFGYQLNREHSGGLRRYEEERERWHVQWKELGFSSRELDHFDDCITGFRIERLPLNRPALAWAATTPYARWQDRS